MKHRSIFIILILLLGSIILSACGPSVPNSHHNVCNGEVNPAAAVYSGTPESGTMKIYVNKDPGAPFESSDIPLYGSPIFGVEGSSETIELVTCVTVQSTDLLFSCEYGYTMDGEEKIAILEYRAASISIEIIVSQTGEMIGGTTFDIDVPYRTDCSEQASFTEGETLVVITPKLTDSDVFNDFILTYSKAAPND